jgi:hypothetical protein
MQEYYLLREKEKVLYLGPDRSAVDRLIQPSENFHQDPSQFRMYDLIVLVQPKENERVINIGYKKLYRLQPGETILDEENYAIRGIRRDDLERLIRKAWPRKKQKKHTKDADK